MSSLAYYLKYRPQSLDDLIGQDQVKEFISSSFKQHRLSHAYLFAGPRGTGKTSTARILAKMVNCEKQSSVFSLQSSDKKSLKAESEATIHETERGEAILMTDSYPCNQCPTCLSITDGSNLDLIEIDAASNRGIEDIRLLREKIKLSPTSSKKKVYIIDEVHMLTQEAFNALLKTLEEPPNHALFILATTDAQKLPQTILSRVQRLDFKPASAGELSKALQEIAAKEKINIDDKALKLLVKRAEGSFRDGIKYLDQVSLLGEKITAELLQKNLNTSKSDLIPILIRSLSKKDTRTSLSGVFQQIEAGVDPKELTLSIMDTFRNLVFIKNGLGEQLVAANYQADQYQSLVTLAEDLTNRELLRNLNILQDALEKLKFASIPALPLELAVVEICDENSKLPSEAGPVASPRGELAKGGKAQNLQFEKQTPNLKPQIPVSNTRHPSSNTDIQKLMEKWTYVLETVRAFNFSLEALLRSISIKECTDTAIIMEVPYSFHQRILEAPKNRDLLESILSDILGRSIQVSTVLGNRPQRHEDIANIEVAADDEMVRVAAEIFSSDSVNLDS